MGIGIVDYQDPDLDRFVQLADYAIKDTVYWAASSTSYDVPNDPEYRFQWGLTRVGAPLAWDVFRQNNNSTQNNVNDKSFVTLCVIDSGIDVDHPDIVANLHPLIGYNAIEKNSDVEDGLKHGTHVAGIIAAISSNEVDVSGIALKTKILSCKFLYDQGYGYASDAVRCIDYCLVKGSDIITNSWSGDGDANAALEDAIKQAQDQDVLFVVAAGNVDADLDATPGYPASYAANYSNVLVVASTNYKDRLSNFSNYGANTVHLGGPGEWYEWMNFNERAPYIENELTVFLCCFAGSSR